MRISILALVGVVLLHLAAAAHTISGAGSNGDKVDGASVLSQEEDEHVKKELEDSHDPGGLEPLELTEDDYVEPVTMTQVHDEDDHAADRNGGGNDDGEYLRPIQPPEEDSYLADWMDSVGNQLTGWMSGNSAAEATRRRRKRDAHTKGHLAYNRRYRDRYFGVASTFASQYELYKSVMSNKVLMGQKLKVDPAHLIKRGSRCWSSHKIPRLYMPGHYEEAYTLDSRLKFWKNVDCKYLEAGLFELLGVKKSWNRKHHSNKAEDYVLFIHQVGARTQWAIENFETKGLHRFEPTYPKTLQHRHYNHYPPSKMYVSHFYSSDRSRLYRSHPYNHHPYKPNQRLHYRGNSIYRGHHMPARFQKPVTWPRHYYL